MKRLIIALFLTAVTSASVNGQTSGTENGHDWVDLGLSVKWATCNVGASSPSDYGQFFAWGETWTKSEYSWSSSKYYRYETTTVTKYNERLGFGTVDNLTTLELSDDVAYKKWEGSWRIPTEDELIELKTKCTWEWTRINGKNGAKVTGKNGNSIFLPAAGYWITDNHRNADSIGAYWSSSVYIEEPFDAYIIIFDSSEVSRGRDRRYYGLPIRPVMVL